MAMRQEAESAAAAADSASPPATTSSTRHRAGAWQPGLLLGVGLGGFVDGIVLHQIAQWHNMGSARVPPVTMDAMRQNMMWDGWFHAAMLVLTVAGVYRLLALARRQQQRGAVAALPEPRVFTGQLLVGWATFNLVEGIIDHHLLQLHHVRDLPAHVPLYDWLFLGIGGLGLLALGMGLARTAPRPTASVSDAA